MNLSDTINKKLIKVSRFDFLIDGKEDEENAGTVQLGFSDDSILELELMPDGESVELKWKDNATVRKEDKKTDWIRIELIDRKPFNQLYEKKVTNTDVLLFGAIEDKKKEMAVAGFGFRFENDLSLVYYNAADLAKIYVNEMPPYYSEPFKLIWKNEEFEILRRES